MDFLPQLLVFLEAAKYPLLFVGCFIEGTVVMMAAGVLWHAGTVDFLPAFISLLLADFLADLVWYFVGYFGARKVVERWGHRFGLTHENLSKVERRFHKHHTWILLVSKLSMGFGLAVATLTTAGMLRVPLYRYAIINGLGGVVWVFAMMLVGYYFGNVLALVPTEYQVVIAVTVLALIFLGLQLLNKRLANSDW
jgi:membrane protein DedA with SNARE-associated domain